ncbi:MAG: serine/threonine-protein phosphatase [Sedimentisphaerales bacterium]|nr:serine/threonine-protein phosphatase [Sedimentisphaerales bacterium]
MQTLTAEKDGISRRLNQRRVLLIQAKAKLPEALREALERLRLEAICCCDVATALELLQEGEDVGAAVLLGTPAGPEEELFESLLEALETHSLPLLVFVEQEKGEFRLGTWSDRLIWAGRQESAEMLQGRLLCLLQIRPVIRRMQAEMERLQTVSQPLNSYFSQVNEEMRIAARLQRDFLPDHPPAVPGFRFATVFRPASWVSGDIYDICRLDENHIGFYIADAVGHGMPAALLTMFIKRALITKIIQANRYTLVDPGEALRQLNADMVAQDLNNFQFATCCYGLLNVQTRILRIASAGHPAPMHINAAGEMMDLKMSGSLLGVFPDQQYDTQEISLAVGDKLLLYSDGVELAFVDEGPDTPLRFRQEFGNLADYDIQTMCDRLVEIIDREEGSLHPRDDVTIVGIELYDGPSS